MLIMLKITRVMVKYWKIGENKMTFFKSFFVCRLYYLLPQCGVIFNMTEEYVHVPEEQTAVQSEYSVLP